MKAKLRKIEVDGQTFLWRAVFLSEESVCLRIWTNGKKTPWVEVVYPFADPWLNFPRSAVPDATTAPSEPLRPGRVAEIIRQVGELHQSSGDRAPPRIYTLTAEGRVAVMPGR